MALNIKNPQTDRLAHELAEATGQTITAAVTAAIEEKLARLRLGLERHHTRLEVEKVQRFVAGLPDIDARPPEEVIGYDEFGLPT